MEVLDMEVQNLWDSRDKIWIKDILLSTLKNISSMESFRRELDTLKDQL